MLNKIKKLKKENIIKYIVILGITILICQNFLQMHYSSDTYVLYDLGYMEYPSQYFLLDGRLISTVVCYLAGILKIPIEMYIVGMDFIGIIFIATAIYMINKILEKIINPEKVITKLMLLAGSFILILNQFTLEYLLFPESAVMCLGVLFNVIAIKFMVDNPKCKYIKIFLTLLVAVFCYQGVLNMFPVLAILVYIVKQILDKREYKVAVALRGQTVLEYMDELWNRTMHMLPENTNTIIVIITFVSLIIMKTKKEIIMQYILLLIISFTICRVEENMGKTIKYALEKYEKETGNKVTKFAYAYDRKPQQYAENMMDKDYEEFSEEQLVFKGNTLYMLVY